MRLARYLGKKRMVIGQDVRETDSVFAGELADHYYYREFGFVDRAMLSMISRLNLLALKEKTLCQFMCPRQKIRTFRRNQHACP